MAQSSIILGFEPRKGNFVAIFEVIKALQFQCFFTLHINSPHYRNINNSDFALGLSICKNGKGLDLGHYFQIRFLWLL